MNECGAVGPVNVTRVEEQLGFASFPPETYFTGSEREVLDRYLGWLEPNHYRTKRTS